MALTFIVCLRYGLAVKDSVAETQNGSTMGGEVEQAWRDLGVDEVFGTA
jgi:hypothetical protein